MFITSEIEAEGLKGGPFLGLLIVFNDKLRLVASANEDLRLIGLIEDEEGGMVTEEGGREDERDGLGIAKER